VDPSSKRVRTRGEGTHRFLPASPCSSTPSRFFAFFASFLLPAFWSRDQGPAHHECAGEIPLVSQHYSWAWAGWNSRFFSFFSRFRSFLSFFSCNAHARQQLLAPEGAFDPCQLDEPARGTHLFVLLALLAPLLVRPPRQLGGALLVELSTVLRLRVAALVTGRRHGQRRTGRVGSGVPAHARPPSPSYPAAGPCASLCILPTTCGASAPARVAPTQPHA